MCGKILRIAGGETYYFDDMRFSESLCELTLTTSLSSFKPTKARQLVGEKAQIRYQGYEMLVTIGVAKLIRCSDGMTVKYCIEDFENLHRLQGSGRFYFYIPHIATHHKEWESRFNGLEQRLTKTSFLFNGKQWILHDAFCNNTIESKLPFSLSELV